MGDLYAILGVPPTATGEQIKSRYRFLAHAYHPDKFSAEAHKQDAEEAFKAINEAFQTLSNPGQRANYDRGRASGPSEQPKPSPPPPRSEPPPQQRPPPQQPRSRSQSSLWPGAIFSMTIAAIVGVAIWLDGQSASSTTAAPKTGDWGGIRIDSTPAAGFSAPQADLNEEERRKSAARSTAPAKAFDPTTATLAPEHFDPSTPTPAVVPRITMSAEEYKAAEVASRHRAVQFYPALGVSGSQFNAAFLAEYYRKKETDSRFFDTPEWPMILAGEIAPQFGLVPPIPGLDYTR